MKSVRNIFHILFPCMVLSMFLISSCEDESGLALESPGGNPVIKYIRVSNPNASDSLLVKAELGSTIVIVGENLGGTREIWFNDQRADLLPTWVTNRSVFATIPFLAPTEVTDKIYLIDANGKKLEHPFKVTIPPPTLRAARNEWPQEGENLIIKGDYFFEPLSVTFTGGVEGEVVAVSQTQIEVTVPEGATEGPINVKTNFGETPSTFHLWDKRNIILNFDDADKRPNGWRIGMRANADEHTLDGYYLVVKGTLANGQRDEGPGAPAESGYCMEYWGGPAGRTENFYPLYPNSYREYALKFEAKVIKWYGGYLNLCLSTPDHAGNNQEIWSNTKNARAIWGPWAEADEEYSTDTWITVVVPMTEFQYYMGKPGDDIVYTPGQKFIESAAGSFSTWLLGSPENTGNEVEFYIDNVRFVKP